MKPSIVIVHMESGASASVGGKGIGQKYNIEIRNAKSLSDAERRASSLASNRYKGQRTERVKYAEWKED